MENSFVLNKEQRKNNKNKLNNRQYSVINPALMKIKKDYESGIAYSTQTFAVKKKDAEEISVYSGESFTSLIIERIRFVFGDAVDSIQVTERPDIELEQSERPDEFNKILSAVLSNSKLQGFEIESMLLMADVSYDVNNINYIINIRFDN